MNFKGLKFLLIYCILLAGCKKNESKPDLPDLSIVDISMESDWDYWVVGKADYYYVKAENSIPKAVLFHSSEANKDYSIFFTAEGMLDKVAVDGYILIFRNFQGTKVDVGVIEPNGNIGIVRGLETNLSWKSLSLKSATINENVYRWAGRIVAGVPCLLSVLAATNSFGFLAPVAAWKCGNYFLKVGNDIVTNELNIHNGLTDFISTYGDALLIYNCSGGDPLGCMSGLASRGYSQMADNEEQFEYTRSADVQTTVGVLNYGYGDVQITLVWNNTADLDLHVFDPKNEEIWWKNKYSYSGGILDVDDTNGYGPENVYWAKGKAPVGYYKVYLKYYVWDNQPWRPSTSSYTILINAFDRVKKYSGSIALGETIHIQDFDQNNFKSATIRDQIIISSAKKVK